MSSYIINEIKPPQAQFNKNIDEEKGGKGEEKKKPIVVRNSNDLQRMKLEKLMKNPDKQVLIPERPKEKGVPIVPDFVRNVMGSSAGAGSGEFHVYRHLRRKEYARQKYMKEKAERERQDEEYRSKIETNKKLAEEKTAKKRAKRLKRKQKMRSKPKKSKVEEKKAEESGSENSSANSDEEGESTAETSEDQSYINTNRPALDCNEDLNKPIRESNQEEGRSENDKQTPCDNDRESNLDAEASEDHSCTSANKPEIDYCQDKDKTIGELNKEETSSESEKGETNSESDKETTCDSVPDKNPHQSSGDSSVSSGDSVNKF